MYRFIHRSLLPVMITLWMLCSVLGLTGLWIYKATAGVAAEAPLTWPVESQISRKAGLPTLVLFLHPHCPCSRATLEELAKLLTQCHDRLTVAVLMLQPPNMPDKWKETDLWRTAAAMPGATVLSDENGRESRRFGAATSGQALLYSADGQVLFAGGITESRGHSGDNAGRDAIVSLVLEKSRSPNSRPAETAVYGCPLFNASSVPGQSGTCRCHR